jgi:hypothetical protein
MFDNLSLFARLSLFAGMFFASIPGLVDGGGDAGGDAGGGAEGGDDGGDGATDEVAGDGSGEDADQGDGSGEGDGGGTGEGEGEGEGDEGGEGAQGGKKVSFTEQQFRKALDEVKKVDPKLADVLRKDHFKLGDYVKVGTLDEVRALKDTLDDLGGEEGITEMRGKVTDYANELMRFAEGDPAAVDDLFKDFPDGGFKLVPIAVNKMRAMEMDEATGLPKPGGHYAQLAARLTSETLTNFGVMSALDTVLRIAHDGGTNAQARVVEELTKLKNWAEGVSAFARRRPQEDDSKKTSDIERREQAVRQEKRGIYLTNVGSEVTKQLNANVARYLNPLLRDYLKVTGKALKLPSKQDVFLGASTRISKALEANSRYQSQLKAMLAKNEPPEKVARFVHTYMEKIAKKSVEAVWETKGHAHARRGVAGKGSGAGAGSARVSQGKKPPAEKIDWSKDPSRMRFISGEATLKKEFGGGVVKWDATGL